MDEVSAELEAKPARKPKSRKSKLAAVPTQGLMAAWQDIPLSEINAEDTTLQFRFLVRTGDVATSLHRDGQQTPIDLVGKKPYRIVDGFRRVAAAHRLGWTSIKAFLHEGIADDAVFRMAFVKNVVRKNLSVMERANACVVCQKRGIAKKDLATTLGISERQVERYLELGNCPAAIQKIVDGTIVTMAHAKLLADHEVDNPAAWRKRIEQEHLDARRLKRALQAEHGKKQLGRKKLYFKKTKDGIRVYPFAITAGTPKAECEKAIKALEEAIAFLKE